MKKLFPLLMSVAALGCPETEPESYVWLSQITGAPPTLRAELVEDEDNPRVTLSEGVAMAVRCSDSCPKMNNPCEAARVEVKGDAVESHEAYDGSSYMAPTFVLTGKHKGSAEVTITTRCAKKTYRAVVQ